MKKLLLFTMLVLPMFASAQSSRLKGAKFFQAGVGFRGAGPNASIYGGMTFRDKVKGSVGGGIGMGKVADISYKYMFLDGIGSFTFHDFNRVFFLNAQAGISFNGDLINDFENEVYKKQFSFNYGIIGGLEAEFYATRNMIFVLSAQERYYIRKEFGHLRYQISAAIRLTI